MRVAKNNSMMAIPGWLWPDNSHRNGGPQRPHESRETSEIENATSLFKILSNTIRLEILVSLHEQSDPTSYTELRESTSVDDKGKFNYHLRKLEHLVCIQDGEYTLTDRGEAFIQKVLSEDLILNHE